MAIMNPFQANEKPESLSREMGSFSKEIEYTKKKQMDILELKNIITTM